MMGQSKFRKTIKTQQLLFVLFCEIVKLKSWKRQEHDERRTTTADARRMNVVYNSQKLLLKLVL